MAQTSCVGGNRASGQACSVGRCATETCRAEEGARSSKGFVYGTDGKKYGLAASFRADKSGQNNSPRVLVHIAQRC